MPPNRLADLTQAIWVEHVGSLFSLRHGDGALTELALIEAKTLGGGRPAAPGRREPYVLVFRAATREFCVPQRMYPLVHPVLGEFEIFLVPIGPDEHGMCFEAIFG